MRTCHYCGVEILDPVNICPLCHCITTDEEPEGRRTALPEPGYPYADSRRKRGQITLRIYIAAAVAAVFILGVINAALGGGHWNRIILIAIFCVYGYAVLRTTLLHPMAYRIKTMLLALLAFLVLAFIDISWGFYGWSFNYIYPALLVILELVAVLYILINRSNFQSYIPLQIVLILLACVPFILYRLHIFVTLRVDAVVLLFVVLVFVMTVFLGGRRARTELMRRFHL